MILPDPFAALRHLFARQPSPEQAQAVVPTDQRHSAPPSESRPAPGQDQRPQHRGEPARPLDAPEPEQGGTPSVHVARLMANYVGARAEEMFELLFEATSRGVADQVARAMQVTREALSAEIASIRESTAATQRESARMGRELVRTGATLEGVQSSLSEMGTSLQRVEAALQGEPTNVQEIRDTLWSAVLGDILATLDGLEAALDEARAIADALVKIGRQIDDPAVRRWWRALNEATGTKRSLPVVPTSDVESWVRGLDLTYRRLRDVLERNGINAIEATGRPFDPYLHEAVAVVSCAPENEGIVLREERKGYRKADRVIRLAQVVVGKPEASDEIGRSPRPKVATAEARDESNEDSASE